MKAERKAVLLKSLAGSMVLIAVIVAAVVMLNGRQQAVSDAAASQTPPEPNATSPGSGAKPTQSSNTANEASMPASNPVANIEAGPEPLPPTDTPLMAVFDELEERANRGDAHASCDLVSRLLRCRSWWTQKQYMPTMVSEYAHDQETFSTDQIVDGLAHDQMSLDDLAPVCSGVTPEQLNRAYDFQVLAAEYGPASYGVELALDPVLSIGNFVNELERWQDYRQRAPGYLEAGLRHGHAGAVLGLARMHAPNESAAHAGAGSVGIVSPDPTRAVLYFLLYQEKLGLPLSVDDLAHYESAKERVNPETILRLRLDAAALERDYFSGFTAPEDDLAGPFEPGGIDTKGSDCATQSPQSRF